MQIAAADIITQFRRRFGIRGVTDLSLDQNIVPVCNVTDLENAPYNAKQGGAAYANVAGVAAQFTTIGLAMQLAQIGSALVPRKMWLSASAPVDVKVAVVPTGFLGATGGAFNGGLSSWDSTDGNDGANLTANMKRSTAYLFTDNNAVARITTASLMAWLRLSLTATPQLFELPYCVRATNALIIEAATVNIGLVGSFFWDEYLSE